MAITKVINQGMAKPNPFTILVIANPAIQVVPGAALFTRDPILDRQPAFDACTGYVADALFARLPGQREPMLGVPAIVSEVRMLSIFDADLPATEACSFVAHDDVSTLLLARRSAIAAFLTVRDLVADVVYAVSASPSHDRASAWFTSDDDARGGVPFTLNGIQMYHRFYYSVPGTIALHVSASSLTAAHEFQHAVSSYTNGRIVDLYVDSPDAVNCQRGRPIRPDFARYEVGAQASNHASDPDRRTLGYPPTWQTFHCARIDNNRPALMDNYWLGSPPESCQNDTITRQFIMERVRAKLAR
jgi:hypothetical protein